MYSIMSACVFQAEVLKLREVVKPPRQSLYFLAICYMYYVSFCTDVDGGRGKVQNNTDLN